MSIWHPIASIGSSIGQTASSCHGTPSDHAEDRTLGDQGVDELIRHLGGVPYGS